MEQLWEVINDPIILGSAYAGVILLIMLWVLALMTRRVRVLEFNLEAMQTDLRLINEEIKDLSLQQRKQPPAQESVDSVIVATPEPVHGEKSGPAS